MNCRRVIAAGCLVAALPFSSGSAQTASPVEPPKWSLSLGVDPTHLDLHTPEPGVDARMVANLTRSWQSANSRFARHISLMVGTDAPREMNPNPVDPQCDCWMKITRRYAGLTAGVSYDLFSMSRFTPYLKGGTGIYYAAFTRGPSNRLLTPPELAAYYQDGFSERRFSLGANGGLGLKARLGSHELFIEQMIHSFDPASKRGNGCLPSEYWNPVLVRKTAPQAGHRDGSFERMRRIFRITRIAPRGVRTRNTRAGIFGNCRSGRLLSPNGSLLRNNKKKRK